MEKSKILDIVYEAMKEINDERDVEKRLALDKSTILFGRGSGLDSLGLVNLIVAIELSILDKLGLEISLTDERALSRVRSPFRTVSSLVNYVCSLLEDVS